ncbi:hypothetical protein D3C71_1791470 [compost metagenome]
MLEEICNNTKKLIMMPRTTKINASTNNKGGSDLPFNQSFIDPKRAVPNKKMRVKLCSEANGE